MRPKCQTLVFWNRWTEKLAWSNEWKLGNSNLSNHHFLTYLLAERPRSPSIDAPAVRIHDRGKHASLIKSLLKYETIHIFRFSQFHLDKELAAIFVRTHLSRHLSEFERTCPEQINAPRLPSVCFANLGRSALKTRENVLKVELQTNSHDCPWVYPNYLFFGGTKARQTN